MATIKQLLITADLILCPYERYRYVGESYGYPECCISLFIENCGTPWYGNRNLKLDGYVPCEKCSNKPRQELVNDINSRRKVEKIK